jgi:hypothetical protein
MFDSDTRQPDLSGPYNLWRSRQDQINRFEETLQRANAGFSTALNNFYTYSMSQFGPNTIPYFQSRGIQAQGGAYQAQLARESAKYNAQFQPAVWQQQIENAQMVDRARGESMNPLMNIFGQGALSQYGAQNKADWASGGMNAEAGGKLGGWLAKEYGPKLGALNWGDLFGGGKGLGTGGNEFRQLPTPGQGTWGNPGMSRNTNLFDTRTGQGLGF